MPTVQNLEVRRGQTYQFTITCKKNGVAINLTGGTLRMTVKWNYTDADNAAAFALSTGSGITHTDAANGVAQVTVSPSNTSSLAAYRLELFYDIRLTDGSGNVFPLAEGSFYVIPNVSITTP